MGLDFLDCCIVQLGFGRCGVSCTMPGEGLDEGDFTLVWHICRNLRQNVEVWGILAPELGDIGLAREAFSPSVTRQRSMGTDEAWL